MIGAWGAGRMPPEGVATPALTVIPRTVRRLRNGLAPHAHPAVVVPPLRLGVGVRRAVSGRFGPLGGRATASVGENAEPFVDREPLLRAPVACGLASCRPRRLPSHRLERREELGEAAVDPGCHR